MPVVELRRANPVRFAVVLIVVIAIGDLLRLHQAHPVQTRLPAEGGVRHGRQHPLQVAGADRRRRRRQGQLDQARGQDRPGDDGNRIARAADPHRRDGQDPPADLPRRQLVRRTAARQPVGEDGLLGLHDPDHADLRSGAARPGARRLNTDTRANLQNFLIYYGEGLTRKPDAAENAEQDPEVRGSERRPGDQQDLPPRARGAARRRDHQPGDHRHRTARPLETDRRHRQGHRGAERARAAARRTDRQLQHVLRRVRARSPRASRTLVARAAELAARASTRGLARLDASFPPTRAFAHDILPGRQDDAGDGHGGAAVDRTGEGLARAQRARRRRQGARGRDALAGETDRRTGSGLQADRTASTSA